MDDYENPSSSHGPDLPEIHKILSTQISTLAQANLRAGKAKFAIQSRTWNFKAVAPPFTAEGYMANISDFPSPVAFIAATQIYCCSTNRAIDHTQVDKNTCVPMNTFYTNKQ